MTAPLPIVEKLRRRDVIRRGETVMLDMGDGPTPVSCGDVVRQHNPDGPQAADIIEELYEALRELLVAVRFADPPKDYGTPDEPNLCHEARIPVDFVTIAERALAKARGDQ